MGTTTETTVEREVAIAASPDTVWEFLVDPEKAVRWMGQTASLDPRPGGEYRVGVIPGHTASGEFVEVDRPNRMVFTWGWEPDPDGATSVAPGSTRVEIELMADGDGTLLRFVHRLETPTSAASHGHGWDHYLPRLALAATGADPGEDPWINGPMD
jgi:uncharacterized protein YndB with AHSA1/START domain